MVMSKKRIKRKRKKSIYAILKNPIKKLNLIADPEASYLSEINIKPKKIEPKPTDCHSILFKIPAVLKHNKRINFLQFEIFLN